VPQLYWQIGFDVADYVRLLPWWSDVVVGTRVQLYTGQADYRVGQSGAWQDPAEISRQLSLNHRYRVSGSVHFSAVDVRADRLGAVSGYRAAHYAEPALVPVMAQLPSAPPAPPVLSAARRVPSGAVTLTWRAAAGPVATSFAVYRTQGGVPAQLVATQRATRGAVQVWEDKTASVGRAYTYCVTAVDRSWNEGDPSAALPVP
jgi:hypothetical protein